MVPRIPTAHSAQKPEVNLVMPGHDRRVDLNSWATLAALLLAVATLILAMWWRTRDRRVLGTSTKRTRLSLNPSVGDLQVTWKGAPVANPVLVEIACADHGAGGR